MQASYIEHRDLRGSASLSWDLARHLYGRQSCCPVAIITEQPGAFLPAIRKQWLVLARNLQSERARTLDATLIRSLTHEAQRMQHLLFTTKSPLTAPEANVFILPPTQLGTIPLSTRTLYVTCSLPDIAQLLAVTAQLSEGSLVVSYDKLTSQALRHSLE